MLTAHDYIYKQDGTTSRYFKKNTSVSPPLCITSHMKSTMHHNQQITNPFHMTFPSPLKQENSVQTRQLKTA